MSKSPNGQTAPPFASETADPIACEGCKTVVPAETAWAGRYCSRSCSIKAGQERGRRRQQALADKVAPAAEVAVQEAIDRILSDRAVPLAEAAVQAALEGYLDRSLDLLHRAEDEAASRLQQDAREAVTSATQGVQAERVQKQCDLIVDAIRKKLTLSRGEWSRVTVTKAAGSTLMVRVEY